MIRKINTAKKLVYCYVTMVAVFTLLLIAAYAIPSRLIRNNVERSEKILDAEGEYPYYYKQYFQLDNFTDGLMLNIAISADEGDMVRSAMESPYYAETKSDTIGTEFSPAQTALDVLGGGNPDRLEKRSYGRYWQGYQAVLRPLLVLTDYTGIRILNYVLLTFLALWCCILTAKRISQTIAGLFVLSLFAVAFPMVPLSMQFSTCFYIALTAMAVILKADQLRQSKDHLVCAFFVIGGLTAYLDFLTTPQLTLGLPLIVSLLMDKANNKWKLIICLSMAWVMGYAGLWASKWVIGSCLTGHSFFANALGQVALRTQGVCEEKSLHIIPIYLTLIGGITVSLAALYFLAGKKAFMRHSYLLPVIAGVPLWYLVVRNHSLVHQWFVYRALMVTAWAYLIFIYYVWKERGKAS